jgi:alkylation response protein AidB-like acyl-CoA dehydrogenase
MLRPGDMDVRDSPAEAAFRTQVRDWLAANLPEGWGEPGFHEPSGDARLAFLKDWSRRLYDAGYVGMTWPKAYGGHEQPLALQAILLEEFGLAEAPEHVGVIGLGMAGPTILAHGTEEQKRRFIPPLLTGDEIWCQGFSEPGSGSDLASLQTKAVRDGDGGFVVSGQKVWSSFAHIADFCILLARTDGSGDKHEGLTYFLLDMRADGVEVRPIRQITGDSEFNEIFLSDARIPADMVLGDVGQGWSVAITTLMNERANIGFLLASRMEVAFRRLVELARSTPARGGVPPGSINGSMADDPLMRDRLARLWADVHALRLTIYRSFSAFLRTGMPGPEGSIAKLFWSDLNQRLTKTALEIEGAFAVLGPGSDRAVLDGRWQTLQLRSRGNSIEGGTSEILRSIVAERVLGLPKSR